MPGPAPKRSDQRRRTNPTAPEQQLANSTQLDRGAQVMPVAPDDWHPLARQWFESLATSGQAALYESSDWMQAAVLAEAVSRELKPQPIVVGSGIDATVEWHEMPMKGATLSAFLKGCTDLLISEASRRRAALELRTPMADTGEKPAPVTDMRAWRASLNA